MGTLAYKDLRTSEFYYLGASEDQIPFSDIEEGRQRLLDLGCLPDCIWIQADSVWGDYGCEVNMVGQRPLNEDELDEVKEKRAKRKIANAKKKAEQEAADLKSLAYLMNKYPDFKPE